jgi:nucleoside triphosphate pyrophosphatase
LSAVASLWNSPVRPTLASNSATRRLLLESAGIGVDVAPAAVDERGLEQAFLGGGGAPSALAAELARAKALEVSARRPQTFCIGADQTLLFDGRLMHKAADSEEAARNLARLAGRSHRLIAAVCVARDGTVAFEAAASAELTMRALDAPAIRRYLDFAGPAVLSSVGAYQIEGVGINLFEKIDGDHATILGLPLLPLLKWLRAQGLLAL